MIGIRVDDIGWTATEAANPPMKQPDTGLRLAQRFHEAMQGRPYLAAIIPAAVDDEGLEWLRSHPQGLIPALHGWDHSVSNGVRNEFHGLSQNDMRVAIDRGRKRLDLDVVHFVPPFNGCEPELAEACVFEGVKYIWGGASHKEPAPSGWATQPPPYPWGRVTFVPSWRRAYGATRWKMSDDDVPLVSIADELVQMPGRVLVTMHIPWEMAKGGEDFSGVRELVELIGELVVTPEEWLGES